MFPPNYVTGGTETNTKQPKRPTMQNMQEELLFSNVGARGNRKFDLNGQLNSLCRIQDLKNQIKPSYQSED